MHYEFREAQEGELEACFVLREACYRTKVLRRYVDSEEFSEHDDHSRHFCLCRRDGGMSQLVGYARVAEAFPERPRLPLLSHSWSDGTVRVERLVRKLLDKHGMVVEAGRLSIPRSAGKVILAKLSADCLTAIYGHGLGVPALLVAADHHESFYEALGFRRILRQQVITLPWRRSQTGVCMLRSPERTASPDRRLSRMLDAYVRCGAIAYHPDDPENFVPDVVHPLALQSSSRLALVSAA